MSDENEENNSGRGGGLNAKFRMQIELQQTEESLRKTRNEITALDIMIRKYQQDFARAKMNLEQAEAKLKTLKNQELELNQNAMRQKRAYISQK